MAPGRVQLRPTRLMNELRLRTSIRLQLCSRCLATQTRQENTSIAQLPALPRPSFPLPRRRKTPYSLINPPSPHTKHIKTYPQPKSTAKAHPFPLQDWTRTHLRDLDPKGTRARLFSPDNADRPKAGDILLTTFKTGDPFSGVCLSVKQRGLDTAILLRNRVLATGVEMWVKIYSPNVQSVEVVQRAQKRPRRARLYYMRKPKHDRGSVEGVVEEYLKRRRLIRGGAVGTRQAKGQAKK